LNRWLLIPLLFFLVSLVFWACQDIIEFDTTRSGGVLVVDGRIASQPGPQFLTLGRTTEEERIPIPETGAEIILFDSRGNSENYTEVEEGRYRFNGEQIQPREGEEYFIEITLKNGEVYRSQPEIISEEIPIPTTLSISFEEIEERDRFNSIIDKDIVRVSADLTIPATNRPLLLRWELEEVYKFTQSVATDTLNQEPDSCFVTRKYEPQRIMLFDGRETESGPIEDQEVGISQIDFTYFQKRFFNLVTYYISPNALEYWERVDEVVNRQGTIFDRPQAVVRGNVFNINKSEELVFGYFEAVSTDTTRLGFSPSQLPNPVLNPCALGRQFPMRACFDCLLLRNSTKQEPEYFEEDE